MDQTKTKEDIDIFLRIRSNYKEMSRTQKKIADYFLRNADKVCFQSLKEIASGTETTEATILRFCNRIGYNGFLQFKRELQEHVKLLMSPNEKISIALRNARSDENTNICERIIEQEKQSLDAMSNPMFLDNLKVFVEEIRNAEHVMVVGHYISETVALYLTQRLRQAGIAARSVDVKNIYEVEQAVIQAMEKDLFILISFPYYSTQTLALIDYLRTTKIRMVSITDRYTSPIAVGSKAVIVCSTNQEIFYNSITAAISAVNILTSALIVSAPERFEIQRRKKDEFNRCFWESERRYSEENQKSIQQGNAGLDHPAKI